MFLFYAIVLLNLIGSILTETSDITIKANEVGSILQTYDKKMKVLEANYEEKQLKLLTNYEGKNSEEYKKSFAVSENNLLTESNKEIIKTNFELDEKLDAAFGKMHRNKAKQVWSVVEKLYPVMFGKLEKAACSTFICKPNSTDETVTSAPDEASKTAANVTKAEADETARKVGDETAAKAAEEAARKAADETARKAADEAATKAADETARKAADEAASKAADETARKAADETASKATDETARKAADETDKKVEDEAAKSAAK